MTQADLRNKLPYSIDHGTSGVGELVLQGSKDMKSASYRHRDNTISFGTVGTSWAEVYEKINRSLNAAGYINN